MPQKARYALLFLLLIPCWVIGYRYDVDLVNLHFVADIARSDLTRVYAQNGTLGRYFYGPLCLIFVSPMGYLSYQTTKIVWLILQTISYVIFWIGLARLYPWLKNSAYGLAWVFIWILCINPIHNNYQSNNIQLMLMAALVVGELWTRTTSRKLKALGGALAVIAAAVKVFPGLIVVYYLLAKPKDVRWGILWSSIACLLLPFVFYGYEGSMILYRGFFENLTTYQTQNSLTLIDDILCLPSLLERLGLSSGLTKAILGVILVAFFAMVVRNREKLLANGLTQARYWAMAAALCVFLNPSTRPHYYIFYIPAYCAVAEQTMLEKWRWTNWQIALLLSGVLVALTQEGVIGRSWNNQLEMWSIPTYGMLLLLGMLAMSLRTPKG